VILERDSVQKQSFSNEPR